ncbi:MAG TPA: ferritin-like domain-containing protein [Kineosporiaceae bacterium]
MLRWRSAAAAAPAVEHALMTQYLYAAFSLAERPDDTEEHNAARARWRGTLITIARQEMGHLATVQNLLRMIGGPVTLDREDYPFRTDFYPFHFRLEPLSKDSLAKYVVAEMPENDAPDAELRQILQRAEAADVGTPNRVGALYRQIIDLVATLDDDLSPRGPDLTLDPA